MIVGVDFDETLVDSHNQWLKFLKSRIGEEKFNEFQKRVKNFDNYKDISDVAAEYLPNHKQFWHQSNLYDNFNIFENSRRTLKYLYDVYKAKILIVSKVYPEHYFSKWNFIWYNFPFIEDFIAAEKKEYIHCDVYIDDNKFSIEEMLKINPNCQTFLIKNSYNINNKTMRCWSWSEILAYFDYKNYLKKMA